MATTPSGQAQAADPRPISVIENELPAYRAISSLAVFSLILGIASILCFTDLWFLLVALAAVVIGVRAIRGINRRSDVLTGAGFARVGIALALACGIAASTSYFVQMFMLRREASQFTEGLVAILKDEPVARTLWLYQPPGYRATKSPDEIVDEMKKSAKGVPGGDPYQTQSAPIQRIKDALAAKGDVHYEKVEAVAVRGLTSYANTLVAVHTPTAKGETQEFALIRIRKDPNFPAGEWMIEEMTFPYKPDSYVEKPEAVDDGHGH